MWNKEMWNKCFKFKQTKRYNKMQCMKLDWILVFKNAMKRHLGDNQGTLNMAWMILLDDIKILL